MNIRVQRVYLTLSLITLGVMVTSILQPSIVSEFQLLIAGSLIAVFGIPHGATDYLLFKNLVQAHYPSRNKQAIFFTYYTFLLAGYALVWMYMPIAALFIFIALSVYHFGQSNWNYLKTNNLFIKSISYVIWGSFVVLVPICIYADEAMLIIQNMTQTSGIMIDYATISLLPKNLLILNIWLLFFLYSKGIIRQQDFFRELFLLILLIFLFYTTPLLVGFSIYFALWHSYGSVLDQISFIKKQKNISYNLTKYYIDALPMIVLSFIGMSALWYLNDLGLMPFSVEGLFFIMISIVTLPHMLLIEQLYERMTNKRTIPQQWSSA